MSRPLAMLVCMVDSVVATDRAEGAGEEKVLSGLRGSVAVMFVPAKDVPPYDGAVVGGRPSASPSASPSTSADALPALVDCMDCLLSSSAEWTTSSGSGALSTVDWG